MDVSEVSTTAPLIVSRIHPDESRGRQPGGGAADSSHPPAFALPSATTFDSAAPVAVDAGTEAALADLKPIDGLPLAEVIHRYVDED